MSPPLRWRLARLRSSGGSREATEDRGEFGSRGFSFDWIGASTEDCGFSDNKFCSLHIAKEFSFVAHLDRLGGGDVPLHLALEDNFGRMNFGLDHGFGADREGALGENFTFKSAVEFEGAIERKSSLDLDLIGNHGCAT